MELVHTCGIEYFLEVLGRVNVLVFARVNVLEFARVNVHVLWVLDELSLTECSIVLSVDQ